MKKILVGKKLGMTEIVDDKGDLHAVTVLQTYKVNILNKMTITSNGYKALSLSALEIDEKKCNYPGQNLWHLQAHIAPPAMYDECHTMQKAPK